MIRLKNLLIVCLILFMIVAMVIGAVIKQHETSMLANGQVVSNKKYGWGLKRGENHKQPELGMYKEIVEKYDGIAIGNKEDKSVYLTFDLGYEAGYTAGILDVLKENNVKATFFITGHYLNSAPELVERMIREGHIIGNHTVNHYSMPEISDAELKNELLKLHSAVFEKTGYEMAYMRPPKGEFSERTLELTNNLGYKTVMWSFAYDDFSDGRDASNEYAKKKILDNIHSGSIILLHATSPQNANVLDECIKEIQNTGYVLKNINEFSK